MAQTSWKERWVLSYIFDYVIVVVFILGFSALDMVEPYHQHFSLDNQSIQYPYAVRDRISAAEAGIIACLFPLVVIIVWTMLLDGVFSHHRPHTNRSRFRNTPWTTRDRLWEMNCGILGLGLAVGGAIVITGALKNATGKPRPDLIARCLPRPGSHNASPFGLSNSTICTQPDHAILKDGFRSFPSGHSSTAFSGLGYLSLFIAGKLHVMDNRGEVWKTVIIMIPLLAAALVAVSRIMDARHHPFDVITGSMLGMFTAWVAYRQYFPSLGRPELKGRAYPRRTWGTDAEDYAQTQIADDFVRTPVADAGFREMEEGRHYGSSESFEATSDGASRKRTSPPAAFVPSGSPYEYEPPSQQQAETIELQHQKRAASFPSQMSNPYLGSLVHKDTEYRSAGQDPNYRAGSVDIGRRETTHSRGNDSVSMGVGEPLEPDGGKVV